MFPIEHLRVSRWFTLPALQFFRHRQRFIMWMAATWCGEMVYDVGAGQGATSKALAVVGLPVKALDITHRDGEEFRIHIADGTLYHYDRNSTVILCRPCHSHFVCDVIERAVECKVRRVLYVGLPKNRKADLGEHAPSFRKVLDRAGADGENVYEFIVNRTQPQATA